MITKDTLKTFMKYIDFISKNTDKLIIKDSLTKEELILQNFSCLIEEVGEASAKIRKMTKMSFNKKKVENFKFEHLEEEIVDILITTLLVAKSVGIKDLNKAIEKKIKKNNDRGY